jgi:eukaryotic-like serine/threonine-protein kinase
MLSPRVGERFAIRRRIGSGSFGVVYEAFDLHRNRTVALKVLERVSSDTVARFKREFRYLAELRHPNLASMYELVVIDELWILVMELIHGSELLEHLAAVELQHSFFDARMPTQPDFDGDATMSLHAPSKPPALSRIYLDHVRSTFRQIAVAIAALHAQGVLHRDIKPSNIMITPEGRVVLLDFGLAIPQAADDTLDRKTMVGTPGFMSPEQVIASPVSQATDWYGFGALLYQALTARPPFRGATALEIIERQLHEDPPRAQDLVGDAPADLASLAYDCMQRDPAARPAGDDILTRMHVMPVEQYAVPRERKRDREIVSRGRELLALRRRLDAARPGDPEIVLLHGSPGSGKSALVDRLLDDVRAEGDTLILAGRCHAWESLPLNAIDALVDSLARELRRERSPEVDAVISSAVAVTELFPVLTSAAGFHGGDETVALPAGERLIARAIAELRAIVLAAAGERRILMVLDDAQWGDYQSAQVLIGLLNEKVSKPLVLILCYRKEDWRTSLLLQGVLNSGARMREIPLKDLSRAATEKLIRQSARSPSKRSIDRIFRASRGNPALIELMSDGGNAITTRLERMSAAARILFGFLVNEEGPIADDEAERALELFEIDEPVRSLANERLVRVRVTGDLREIDVYHPRIRNVLRSSYSARAADAI